jgi:hypothetical protein
MENISLYVYFFFVFLWQNKIIKMELKVNIKYPQVLELVGQLPEKDVIRLAKHIQNKYAISAKKWVRPQRHTPLRELIMQAPTWTDEEYNDYLEARQHINQSRLK